MQWKQWSFFRLRKPLKNFRSNSKISVFLEFWYISPPQAENFNYFCIPFAVSFVLGAFREKFPLKYFYDPYFLKMWWEILEPQKTYFLRNGQFRKHCRPPMAGILHISFKHTHTWIAIPHHRCGGFPARNASRAQMATLVRPEII